MSIRRESFLVVRIAFPPFVADAMLEIEKGCVPRGINAAKKSDGAPEVAPASAW